VPVGEEPPSAEDDDDLWETAEPDVARVRPVTDAPPGELPQRRVVVIDDETDTSGAGRNPQEAGTEPSAAIGGTLRQDEGQRRRWRLFRKGGE
jgi:hypothetical protein